MSDPRLLSEEEIWKIRLSYGPGFNRPLPVGQLLDHIAALQESKDRTVKLALASEEEVLVLTERVAQLEKGRIVHIVFDGPPSHESGRFVEVETPDRRGLSVGTWMLREDGYWVLVLALAGEDSDV